MNNKQEVRLRYAPSPTGKLHIGGARTALFNYLYAKHHEGLFIVRIEDTDTARNIENGESEQIDNLKWLGIEPDIYPDHNLNLDEFKLLRQSERLDIYNKYVDELLERGLAYECWCSPEELELEREDQKAKGIKAPKYSRKCLHNPIPKPGVTPLVRLKMPDSGEFSWNDGVRGQISFSAEEIEDWVIRKSNGLPTYNFANVIDDHLMKITHVMRGEEHISNTPKQIYLYQLFDWELPKFIHLTIIIGEDNKKLSKRDEKVFQFVGDYNLRGYLPKAIFNYLSLLGWSPKSEEEIFSKDELINLFNLEGLSKAPSKFDLDKLKWTNNYYFIQMDRETTFENLKTRLDYRMRNMYDEEQKKDIVMLFKEQIHEGIELQNLSNIFYVKDYLSLEEEKLLSSFETSKPLLVALQELQHIDEWTKENIKQKFKEIGKKVDAKGKNLFMPIRLIITGREHGPDLMQILTILGKKEVLKRIDGTKIK